MSILWIILLETPSLRKGYTEQLSKRNKWIINENTNLSLKRYMANPNIGEQTTSKCMERYNYACEMNDTKLRIILSYPSSYDFYDIR